MNKKTLNVSCVNCNLRYIVNLNETNVIRCRCGTRTKIITCDKCSNMLRIPIDKHLKFNCSCGYTIEYVNEFISEKSPFRIKTGFVGLYNKGRRRLFR